MGCSRVRREKHHLLLDACLCMKGSLLDGFPFTEFFSLPTFDYLTALSKITLDDGKRETVRSLILCAFHQLDHSVYSHIAARLWKGTRDRCQHPAIQSSKEW